MNVILQRTIKLVLKLTEEQKRILLKNYSPLHVSKPQPWYISPFLLSQLLYSLKSLFIGYYFINLSSWTNLCSALQIFYRFLQEGGFGFRLRKSGTTWKGEKAPCKTSAYQRFESPKNANQGFSLFLGSGRERKMITIKATGGTPIMSV
ncbi:MAG TPA: hypothetical protein EYP32_01415 [Aquificaceae bacterium]|nr:hypothetical protein [Aquificaceae bacterium]